MATDLCDLSKKYAVTYGKDRYHQQTEMSHWCDCQFGTGKWIGEQYPKDWTVLPNWTIHSMFGYTTFSFKHQPDYLWFVMRWM